MEFFPFYTKKKIIAPKSLSDITTVSRVFRKRGLDMPTMFVMDRTAVMAMA